MAERAALVTGASSGIGYAIARALAEDGYGVTVSARRPEKLEEAAKALADEGLDVRSVPANMSEEDDIRSLAESHRDHFGRLDVLVNNAGIGIGGEIAEAETKKLDLQLDVNLRGVYLMSREAIPALREAGRETGKALVINISSIAGKFGQPWLAAYSATKAAVVGLSQSMQGELGSDGVKITAFCPGFVATAMTDWVEGVPKEEMIQPEDIAEAVRFLLKTSPACIVPEIQFVRPNDRM
jgi:NAD(P)-dependent dehydrogenase (short-subunit alcohol dehydrogenase family)